MNRLGPEGGSRAEHSSTSAGRSNEPSPHESKLNSSTRSVEIDRQPRGISGEVIEVVAAVRALEDLDIGKGGPVSLLTLQRTRDDRSPACSTTGSDLGIDERGDLLGEANRYLYAHKAPVDGT